MNYIWLGNNEQINPTQNINININNQINTTTPINNMSIGGLFNLLFNITVTSNINRVWV